MSNEEIKKLNESFDALKNHCESVLEILIIDFQKYEPIFKGQLEAIRARHRLQIMLEDLKTITEWEFHE